MKKSILLLCLGVLLLVGNLHAIKETTERSALVPWQPQGKMRIDLERGTALTQREPEECCNCSERTQKALVCYLLCSAASGLIGGIAALCYFFANGDYHWFPNPVDQ